jgi:probable HAF family extracellular repeat protein
VQIFQPFHHLLKERRMNRIVLIPAMVVLLLVVGNAWGGVQYTVTDLGALGGDGSYAYGINNSGQVVGRADTVSGAYHAFLYNGGVMTDLGTLPGGEGAGPVVSCATSINAGGQIVGWSQSANGVRHAFFNSSGSMTDLGTLGGWGSEAYGINTNGQVVGWAEKTNNQRHAFLYSNGNMADLGTFYGSSYADDINNSGQVVGCSDTAFATHAFLYSNGTMIDLHTPGGFGFGGSATSINDSGQVVGYVSVPIDGTTHAFYYNGGSMIDLGPLGTGINSGTIDINNSGQIVGVSAVILNNNGNRTNLNELIDPASKWILKEATAINDFGWIVGSGENPSGQTHAFLLTPIDVPTYILWKGGNDDTATAWGVANNWSPSDSIPDRPTVKVRFGTQAAACPIVDMVMTGRTVGCISFADTTSTTIRSTYGFDLTLDNYGKVSTIDVAGTHTISVPVIIRNDVTISGSGILHLSDGISGNHVLNVQSTAVSNLNRNFREGFPRKKLQREF